MQRVVILGTGGTIAGRAERADDAVGYRAGEIGLDALLGGLSDALREDIEGEQVAQLDSKDMTDAVWWTLAQRVAHHAARDDVAGIVVTHGTDTMEETAYLLQRVLPLPKPVVLTGAMRPATSPHADGPGNIADAIRVARAPVSGVYVCFAGSVFGAVGVRKRHPYRLDAFGARDGGPLGFVEEGAVRWVAAPPMPEAPYGLAALPEPPWPWVEIVTSHAGARGATVEALVAAGVKGLVVAGTGNATIHAELESALHAAAQAGVRIVRASRCAEGAVVGSPPGALASFGALSVVQARIELQLELLAAGMR